MNQRLLRAYIAEVMMQEFKKNPACADQLYPRNNGKGKAIKKDKEEEVDEMSVAANVAGFTAPLGYSSEDVKGPGVPRRRKRRSSFARWK